jgi:hypothetical protein
MKKISKLTAVSGVVGFALAGLCATSASAQATRTWVSGVGDDVNPCSRTAPCKTFAGAISKTAPGGEINCLDPGGFGAVTITKAMTISCPYTEGGALAGGNGIVVNAQPTDVVVIRGLDIFGVNPPTNGVRFIAGGELHIEDCVIRRFNAANSQGVSFQPSGASLLYIVNTTISTNGNGATGGGILVQPTGTGTAKVSLRDVRVHGNANNGIRIDSTGNSSGSILVTMENSEVAGNGNGINVISPAAGAVPTRLLLQGSNISNNPGTGITANGAQVQLRVGNSTIAFNGTGLSTLNSANIFTYGDNRLGMNIIADGTFAAPAIPKS